MMLGVFLSDTFPVGCRFALAGLSLRLQATVACAAWDAGESMLLSCPDIHICIRSILCTISVHASHLPVWLLMNIHE